MRQRAADKLDQKLVAKRRKIIEVDRLARDVASCGLVVSRRGDRPRSVFAMPGDRGSARPCRLPEAPAPAVS